MILGSKEIFIPKYLDGTKFHSIREGERWREGMSIQFYTNVRTKNMRKFMPDGVCKGVQKIVITNHPSSIIMTIDNMVIFFSQMHVLAKNDGFEPTHKGVIEFIDFFFPDKKHGEFKGQIVHWTDFKYTYQCFPEI